MICKKTIKIITTTDKTIWKKITSKINKETKISRTISKIDKITEMKCRKIATTASNKRWGKWILNKNSIIGMC